MPCVVAYASRSLISSHSFLPRFVFTSVHLPRSLWPLQLEQQLALVETGRDVVQRDPLAAVPDDDGARAVVVGRDDALEVDVVDGVVLDVHREALVGGVRRRPLRHGPRLQHAVELEPEVVVSAARGVLLHDEPLAARRGGAEGLRGSIRLSLCAITL